MQDDRFSLQLDALKNLSQEVLRHAKSQGASAAETEISNGFGQNVTVRLNAVETIEYNRDKGMSVTVYFGARRGHASTSDLSPRALRDTVEKACAIARYTAEDAFCGLADASLLATDMRDLDLYHPWDISVEQAIEIARCCEAAAMETDSRITNSDGASVSLHQSLFVYANSHGFCQGYPTSRHSISCMVIAEDNDAMQRDYWYTTARAPQDMEDAMAVGRKAGERTIKRLNPRPIATCQVPVLFDPSLASALLSHFTGAISGGNLYRKASFLLDSAGQQVFSALVNLSERPHLPRGLASSAFDNEGVRTADRELVKDGVLQGYLLSSYSARKLGMVSTGNAGGSHNLLLQPGAMDFDGLVRHMGTGLVVTELLGHGINMVTGDYSRGAAGFWVENGEIQHPVEEITIAGNLKEMFRAIVAVGNDVLVQGACQCGSLLVERMTVASQ